jgi:osmoprotectant transport system permease protein
MSLLTDSLLTDTAVWLSDKAHYRGVDGVPHRLAEHLLLTGVAVGAAALVALPLGLLLGHLRRGGQVVTAFANASRAVPTLGILIIFSGIAAIGIGNRAALLALALFAVPPILTNTYVGVAGVEPEALEAARGMGMTGRQVLLRVELPLALGLVVAGLRNAIVQVVATATLAAYVGGGGLGTFINRGYGQQDYPQVLGGAVCVAGLALALELGLGAVQRLVTPAPLRPGLVSRSA